jgi:hypothetical protein
VLGEFIRRSNDNTLWDAPIKWSAEEVEEHFVDLDNENINSLNDYFVINLLGDEPCYIKNSVYLKPVQLLGLIKQGSEVLLNRLKERGYKENQRVLLFCYHGGTSLRMAYLLSLLGYQSDYTYISQTKNEKLFRCDVDFFDYQRRTSNFLIKKYKPEEVGGNTILIHLLFGIQEIYNLPNDIPKDNLRIIFAEDETGFSEDELNYIGDLKQISIDDISDYLGKDEAFIFCTTELNCLLTKHYLNDLGYGSRQRVYLYQYKI